MCHVWLILSNRDLPSAAPQLFGKKQDQVVIHRADRFILDTLPAPVPDAGPVRNITAPDIHPLRRAVAAAYADTKADRIRIPGRGLLRGLGKSMTFFIETVIEFAVRVVMCFVLTAALASYTGLMWAWYFGSPCGFLMCLALFLRERKKLLGNQAAGE